MVFEKLFVFCNPSFIFALKCSKSFRKKVSKLLVISLKIFLRTIMLRYLAISVLIVFMSLFECVAATSTTASRVYGQLGNFTSGTPNNGGISANTLSSPLGVAFDSSNNVYIADRYPNNRVLFYVGTSTTASRVYGSANSLFFPGGVAVDGSNNVYIAGRFDNRVLFYVGTSTTASRVYGQLGNFTSGTANNGGISANSLFFAAGVAVDGSNNVYIADRSNHRVLFYVGTSTTASRVYGQLGNFTSGTWVGRNNGGISANSLFSPVGVAVDGSNNVYISDTSNNRVLFYVGTSTTASRVYGQLGNFTSGPSNNGGISANSLSFPNGVAVDSSNNVYIADSSNHRVLIYVGTSTTATRLYGQLGSFTSGTPNNGGISANSLSFPDGVAFDSSDNVYIADSSNNRVLFFSGFPSFSTLSSNQTAILTVEEIIG